MQVAIYIIPTARKYKRLTSNQLNMNIEKTFKVCERAEQASLEIFAYVPKLLFLSMFELVLTNFVCMFVGYFVTQCTYIMCSFSPNANDMAL